jgi:uncharacterized membrane protein
MFPMIMFLFMGVLFIALSVPLMLKKVPPNNWYGFRTPKTLSDEKIWYEVNRISAQGMALVGLVLVVVTLALMLLAKEMADVTKLIVIGAIAIVALAFALFRSFKALSQM